MNWRFVSLYSARQSFCRAALPAVAVLFGLTPVLALRKATSPESCTSVNPSGATSDATKSRTGASELSTFVALGTSTVLSARICIGETQSIP